MSRRIVPRLFWAGMVLSSVLVATRVWAAWAPDVRGHWDGFFLEADDGGVVGLIRSDITVQSNRRIEGEGELGLEDEPPLEAYNFQATVAADDDIVGTGQSTAGRVVLRGGFQTFAGVQGSAGIWDPDLLFVPRRGHSVRVGATLLHPFPDHNAPDLGGLAAQGAFQGLTDPTFGGTGVMMLGPLERGSFPGSFAFTPANPNLQNPFSWPVRATTSANRKFIMVGQGKTGRMSYDGAIIVRGGSPPEIWGIARLSLQDGRVLFNAINFSTVNR